jgi:LPS sulfotransferase NodH
MTSTAHTDALERSITSRASSKFVELAARALGRAFPQRMASAVHDPIFFIGSGRSGTNLLARLLRSHPALSVFPSEANDLWHPLLYPWHESTLDVPPTWADGPAFAKASLEARTPADDVRLRAVFGAYQRMTRGAYFVNKSVMITFLLDHVLQVFGDARFIHLLRDGRSVALSFAKKEIEKIPKARERYARYGLSAPLDELVVLFAESWRDQMIEIDRHRARLGDRLIELRYEDLCANPDHELRRIADQLRIDPNLFTRTGISIRSQDHKFAGNLGPAAQQRVAEVLAPTLHSKGYHAEPQGR